MPRFKPLYQNELIKLTRRVLVLVGVIALLLVPLLIFAAAKVGETYVNAGPKTEEQILIAAENRLRQYEDDTVIYDSELEAYPEGDPTWIYLERQTRVQAKILEEARKLYAEQPEALAYTFMEPLLYQYSEYSQYLEDYEKAAAEFGADSPEAQDVLRERNFTPRQLEEGERLGRLALNSRKLEDFLLFNIETDSYGQYGPETDAVRTAELWALVEEKDTWLYDFNTYSMIQSMIYQVQEIERFLRLGVDQTGGATGPLTPALEAQLRDQLEVYLFQLDHTEYLNANNGSTERYLQDLPVQAGISANMLTFVILVIGMMILAASSVSQEIETGTIKALIISPARRWKILLAKYAALLTLTLALFLMKTVWTQLLGLLFFGQISQPTLLMNVGGTMMAIPGLAAAFLILAAEFVHVAVYVTAALTLSTVIRKTAITVGLSIAIFFGSLITMMILLNSRFSEIFRLLPFLHMDLGGRLGASFSQWLLGGSFYRSPFVQIPVWMTVVYLTVFVGLLLATSLDSFGRRDI